MIDLFLFDDDEDDRDLFCQALHDLDPSIRVSLAVDGEAALTMLFPERRYNQSIQCQGNGIRENDRNISLSYP